MPENNIKRVAIIGAGPAGAIAVDAFVREQAFDVIRVFERREKAGGCWSVRVGRILNSCPRLTDCNIFRIQDAHPPNENKSLDLRALAGRTADWKPAHPIPASLPAYTPRSDAVRYSETASYSYLETNIDVRVMEYSQEPIAGHRTERSVKTHGPDTPFRSGKVVQRWVEGLVDRNGYRDFVEYSTTVELAQKVGGEWRLVLRRQGAERDYWWWETFDALVVASGHYGYVVALIYAACMHSGET